MTSIARPRPPSVEPAARRRAAAPRGRASTRPCCRGRARGRRRRAGAAPGRGKRHAATSTWPRRPRGTAGRLRRERASSRSSTPPASSSTRTSGGRRGRRPPSGPRSRRPSGPSLLELDRETGRRGARFRAAEEHLVALTGAEDALVTNNNAAALALAVGLAGRGGAWPSLARRARRDRRRRADPGDHPARRRAPRRGRHDEPDPRRGLRARPSTAGRATLVLRVHPSNFRMEGFTESAGPGRACRDSPTSMARSSSTTWGAARCWTPRPTAWPTSRRRSERLAAGADLVTFSGDKLARRPAGGADRRSSRPHRPDPARPAGARRCGRTR